MLLYHGTPTTFDTPSLLHAKDKRDFGAGFYLAENEIDAVTIAIKNSTVGTLYTYEIADEAYDNLNIVEYDDYGDSWLKCIYNHRMLKDEDENIDIIIGPTAGGTVNDLFSEWRKTGASFDNVKEIMSKEITHTKFGTQWCLKTDKALQYLCRVTEEEVERE